MWMSPHLVEVVLQGARERPNDGEPPALAQPHAEDVHLEHLSRPGASDRHRTGQDVRRAFKSLGAGMDFGQSGGTWKLTPHTAIGSSTSGRLLIQPQAAS